MMWSRLCVAPLRPEHQWLLGAGARTHSTHGSGIDLIRFPTALFSAGSSSSWASRSPLDSISHPSSDSSDYNREVPPVILPNLADRPQVLYRHVDGHEGKEFSASVRFSGGARGCWCGRTPRRCRGAGRGGMNKITGSQIEEGGSSSWGCWALALPGLCFPSGGSSG